MKDCTKLISIYRDALRCFWNHHVIQIVNDGVIDVDEYILYDKYRNLCRDFLLNEGQSIFFKLNESLDQSHILRREVVGNGNVGWVKLQVRNFIKLQDYYEFLGFFDFNENSIRDLRYVVFATHDGVEHLVDFDYCSFFQGDTE